jgi:hypothetical protein
MWSFRLDDNLQLKETDDCRWILLREDEVLFSSTHPSSMLRECYKKGLINFKEALQIASVLQVDHEFIPKPEEVVWDNL